MNRTTCMHHAKRLALGLAALALAATPSFAQTTYDLCASDGTVTINGNVIPIWGYADITGGGACTTGLATLPGPQLAAADGETLTINLSNALGVPVSIFIPGLAKAVSPVMGADGAGRERLISLDATVPAASGPVAFQWTVSAGTYLYHSGADVRTQVPMGLYGALVVTGGAYPAIADEVLVFSEIDPDLNADPAGFGGARVSTWDPQYFLVNGAASPGIADIAVNVSEDTLLRFVNAGLDTFVPTLGGGLYMDLIAEDGNLYPYPLTQYGLELQAGKTYDAVINAGAVGTYALYDRSLHLANGGMMLDIVASEAAGAPVVADDSYSVAEDGSLVTIAGDATFPGVLDNDGAGADAAVLVSGPSAGTLVGGLAADGSFTYEPAADFAGSDHFTYVANNGAGGPNSLAATATITVTPVNDAPVAVADGYEVVAGEVLSVAAPGVLGNDSDPDGDALSVGVIGGTDAGLVAMNADGSFTFDATLLAAGYPGSFDYDACDPSAVCTTGVVSVAVIAAPTPVNNPPIAADDTTSIRRGTSLVSYNIINNDDDGEGNFGAPFIDPTSVVFVDGTTTQAGGTVTDNNDGTISYTPRNTGYRGTDTFRYTVRDADGALSNIAVVRINVTR